MVGATAAYACALRSVIEEIVLIDRSEVSTRGAFSANILFSIYPPVDNM